MEIRELIEKKLAELREQETVLQQQAQAIEQTVVQQIQLLESQRGGYIGQLNATMGAVQTLEGILAEAQGAEKVPALEDVLAGLGLEDVLAGLGLEKAEVVSTGGRSMLMDVTSVEGGGPDATAILEPSPLADVEERPYED